jgi:hypothetical protein
MKRFVQGQERSQGTLFPTCLDEYISDDNPVRVIDVFVEELQPASNTWARRGCQAWLETGQARESTTRVYTRADG